MTTIKRGALAPLLVASLAAPAEAQDWPALLSLPALTAPAVADAGTPGPFVDGARCLFIGHSFFVPVAGAFDQLASQNSFPMHAMDAVFRPGNAGAPGAMWADSETKAEVEAILASGEVDLFGLTRFGEFNSSVEDYSLWFDLALQYNPETRFLIGSPWVFGGPSLETAAYDGAIVSTSYDGFETIHQLRAAYPDQTIEYIAYGRTASTMKARFEAGLLPDITELVGVGPNALFADGLIGHAGPMMLELAALTWIALLYGAPLQGLVYTSYQSDVPSIVDEVLDFNQPFPAPSALGTGLASDVGTVSLSAGGEQRLSLDAGAQRAGQTYLVIGSTSGTGPTPIPGTSLELPLAIDAYFNLTLTAANTEQLSNTIGLLDPLGQGQAQIHLPPNSDPALAGVAAHHAYVALDGGLVDFVSNPVQLLLVP